MLQNGNFIFIAFGISSCIILIAWYKTTINLDSNTKMLQAIEIFAGLVLALSFVMMVYEHNKSNNTEIKSRVLQLTMMNREYWIRIMELFMKHQNELQHLGEEIFVGYPDEYEKPEKTLEQKRMEYFVIEIMFQMLVDVFRMYDINYLPSNDVIGWKNTFMLIFSSETVRIQWKHSRMLYGNSRVHDFIEKHGIVNSPKNKLLDEIRKSHIVTLLRNNKMKEHDFDQLKKQRISNINDIGMMESKNFYNFGRFNV